MSDALRARLTIDTDTKAVDSLGSRLDAIFDKRHTIKLDAEGSDKTVKELAAAAQKALGSSDVTIDARAGSVDKVKAELDSLFDTQKKALIGLKAGGREGTDEYRNLRKAALETRGAIDQLEKEAESVTRTLGASPPKGGLLTGAINFAAISTGVSAVSTALTQVADPLVKLDTATASMRTLGAEGKAMADNLQASALSLAKELPISADQIQQTMFDAMASGVKGGEEGLKTFADTAGKLAVGGGASIGEATQLLAGQLNAYGQSSEQAARFADVFFNTVNFGVTSVQELSSNLANVVPTAAGAGIEIENVGAAVAVLTQKGIGTAQSTTKLNQLLIELQKPAAGLAPILDKAGVSLDSLRADDLPVTLGKVKAALEETGKSAVQVFGSSEASAAFAALTGDMTLLEQTFRDVQGTTGSTEDAYGEMAQSIAVQTDQIKSKIEAFQAEALGVLPNSIVATGRALVELAPSATSLGAVSTIAVNSVGSFGKLTKSIKDAGGAVSFITEKAPGLAKLGGYIGDSAKSALELGKMLFTRAVPGTVAQAAATGVQTGATVGATVATRALSLAMTALPIFAIIAAVGLLVAALAGLFSGGESVEEALEGVSGAMETNKRVFADTAANDKQQQSLRALSSEYDTLKGKTDPESVKRLAEVQAQLASAFPMATEGAKALGEQQAVNTDIVRSYIDTQLRANEAMRAGAAAELAKETGDLVDATREAKEEADDLAAKREKQQKRLTELEAERAKGVTFANRNIGTAIEAQQKALQETDIELGKVNKSVQDGEKAVREAVTQQVRSGLSWQEIAKQNGISTGEAKRYFKEQQHIEQQAYAAEKAASSLTAATFDAVQQAASLAEQWNKAKSEVDAALNTAKGAVLQIRKQIQDLGDVSPSNPFKAFEKGILAGKEKAQFDVAVGLNADKNEIDRAEKELESQLNPTTEVKPTLNTSRIEKQILDFTDTWIKNERSAFDIRETLRIKALENDGERLEAENANRLRLIQRDAQDELNAIDKRIAEVNKKETAALAKARENLADAEAKNDQARIRQYKDEVAKRTAAIENNKNVEIIALTEARTAIADAQRAKEEEANAQLLEQQLGNLRDRLAALAEAELAQYDAQTGLLALARERRGENDGTAIQESLNLQLELIDRQFDQQEAKLAEQSEVFKEYQEGLAKEAAAGKIKEADIAGLLEAKKQEIILAELDKGNALYQLLLEQRLHAEGKAVDEAAEKWEEWFKSWEAAQESQTDFERYMTGVREAIYEAHTDALTDEARRGLEERLRLLNEESDRLAEEYSHGEKSYQDYVDKLVDIARQKAEAEEELAAGTVSFQDDMNARLAAGFQRFGETAQNGLNTILEQVANLERPVKDSLDAVLAVTGAALGTAAVTSQNIAEAGANTALEIAGQVLTSLVPVFIAQIFGSSFAAGPFGAALAAVASAALLALVGKAKGALSKKFHDGTEYATAGPVRRGKGAEFQAMILEGEGVVNVAAADAGANREYIRLLNRERRPLEQIPAIRSAVLKAVSTERRSIAEQIRFVETRIPADLQRRIQVIVSSPAAAVRLEQVEAHLAATNERLSNVVNELQMIRTQESFRKVNVRVSTNTEEISAREAREEAIQSARS